jgi:hypothetical protein
MEDKLWHTRARPGRDFPGACRPHAEREGPTLPWLEAAGLKEAGDHCGEARVLEEIAEESRSDTKEWNPNKEKTGQNSAGENTPKSRFQPKTRFSLLSGNDNHYRI